MWLISGKIGCSTSRFSNNREAKAMISSFALKFDFWPSNPRIIFLGILRKNKDFLFTSISRPLTKCNSHSLFKYQPTWRKFRDVFKKSVFDGVISGFLRLKTKTKCFFNNEETVLSREAASWSASWKVSRFSSLNRQVTVRVVHWPFQRKWASPTTAFSVR